MTDLDALRRAILDRPDDDTPRLVWADAAEEAAGTVACPACGGRICSRGWKLHPVGCECGKQCDSCRGTGVVSDGLREHAEFVRVQVELARWTCDFKQTPEQPGWRHDCGTDERGYWHCQPLRSRERELFDRHKCEWFGERWAILDLSADDADTLPGLTTAVVRRGFVAEWHGPLAVWAGGACGRCNGNGHHHRNDSYRVEWVREYGPNLICDACKGARRTPGVGGAVVAAHPVTKVVPVGVEPWAELVGVDLAHGFCWWRGSAWDDRSENRQGNLPDDVFDLMGRLYPTNRLSWGGPPSNQHIGFPTPAAALLALSGALLAHARAANPASN